MHDQHYIVHVLLAGYKLVVHAGCMYGYECERHSAVHYALCHSYIVENTMMERKGVKNEVYRYITWPGQAVGYKTGQIVISRLRQRCETKLGSRFDLKAFHDLVCECMAGVCSHQHTFTSPLQLDCQRAWIRGGVLYRLWQLDRCH